jgi:hypothetical protein
MHLRTYYTPAPWVILAFLGFLTVLLTTRYGIGASPDSVAYIGGARNLAAGHGFTMKTVSGSFEVITHFAPLYSWVLSVAGILTVDPMVGARWINAILFGLNILLVGIWIVKVNGIEQSRKLWLPLVGCLVLLTAPTMLEIHIMAWTEPLFIFFAFTGLFFLGLYLQKFEFRNLLLSSILVSLAFLSRYAGIALVAAGMVGIISFSSQNLSHRFKSASFFASISLFAPLLWMARNFLSAGTATSRVFGFHPIDLSKVREAITTISSWFLIPGSATIWIKIIPLMGIILAYIYLVLKKQNLAGNDSIKPGITHLPVMVKLLILFSLTYMAFLVFSISFVDANTPLDYRILSPLYVSSIVLVFYLVGEYLARYPKSLVLKTSLIFWGIFMLAFNVSSGSTLIQEGYDQGIGYNSLTWSRSDIWNQVEQLSHETVVYTNAPEVIYFYTNRPAMSIPRKFESSKQQANADYFFDLEAMRIAIEDQQAVLLYFSSINRPTLASEDELKAYLSLRVLVQVKDGTIYAGKHKN